MLLETPEVKKAIADAAAKHFDYFVETAERWNRDKASVQAEATMGNALVAAALAMAPGAAFSLGSWLSENGYELKDAKLAFAVLPYISGSLGLLDMVFVHAELGDVPIAEVHDLMTNEGPRVYQGVELTTSNVFIEYRRTPGPKGAP